MSALSVPSFPLSVNGVEYQAEQAVCDGFRLMVEDHGMFAVDISLAGPGWGQGLPLRALDDYDEHTRERIGTAFGMDFIIQAVRVLGSPEQAKGVRVVVLRKGTRLGLIEGFARLNDDGSIGDPFLPADLAERHYPSDVSA